MDLLEKLKLLRDDLNLLIEAEEKKRGFQSTVGKSFQECLSEKMQKKMNETVDNVWRNGYGGIKIQDEL